MNFAQIFAGALIGVGALVMAVNIFKFRGMPRILDRFAVEDCGKLHLFLKSHHALMVFFFFGYLVTLYAIIARVELVGELFVGVIFFFGALFVYLGIVLHARMLQSIKYRYNQMKAMGEALTQEQEQLEHVNQQLKAEVEQRKRAQKYQQQALKDTKTILKMMPIGVIVVGRDKKIRMVNKAALQLMGASSEQDIIGHTCHQNICPAEQNRCPVLDLGHRVDASDKILLNRKGERIPILKTVLPLELEGEMVLLEAFMDISERKQAEAKIRQAMLAAKAANKSKSDFLANMSHELRTPLNHVIGFTQLVVDQQFGALNVAQHEHLEYVLQSSTHLLALINDVLDLSKVEAGKMALEISAFSIRSVIDSGLTMVKEKALKHRIALVCESDDIPDIVYADERKLKQILYNLLSNAVKFTPDGGQVILRVRTVDTIATEQAPQAETSNGGQAHAQRAQLEVSVIDTGIGLAKEDLEQVFEPFEQVDSSVNRQHQGTGLGLALTKKFVGMHGGSIWAESPGQGRGCTFRLLLPLLDAPEDLRTLVQGPSTAEQVRSAASSSM